jgi:hypothetical protein
MSVWLATSEITCGTHSSLVGPTRQLNILLMCRGRQTPVIPLRAVGLCRRALCRPLCRRLRPPRRRHPLQDPRRPVCPVSSTATTSPVRSTARRSACPTSSTATPRRRLALGGWRPITRGNPSEARDHTHGARDQGEGELPAVPGEQLILGGDRVVRGAPPSGWHRGSSRQGRRVCRWHRWREGGQLAPRVREDSVGVGRESGGVRAMSA